MCGFAILLFAKPSPIIAVHQTFAIFEAFENLFQGQGCGELQNAFLVPFTAQETAFAKKSTCDGFSVAPFAINSLLLLRVSVQTF